MRRFYAAAALVCSVLLVALWWSHGGQHWLAVKTGTCPEIGPCSAGPGPWYGFFSGFGSDFGEITILTGIGAFWWHHACHEPRCWRWARVSVDDRGTRACYRHHPEGRPRRGHIARAHRAHQERLHLYLGNKPGRG